MLSSCHCLLVSITQVSDLFIASLNPQTQPEFILKLFKLILPGNSI